MRRITLFLVSLLLIASVGTTQDYFFGALDRMLQGEAIGVNRTALDVDELILVRFIGDGTDTFAKVTVGGAAVDTLTFTQDATDGTTASDEFECPESGALGGVIDLTDTSCDTLGEVVDAINESTSWRAVILDGLRTDVVNGTTGGFLADAADQDCQSMVGDKLLSDTSEATAEWVTMAVTESRSMEDYLGGSGPSSNLIPRPFEGKRAAILRAVSVLDQSAAGTFAVSSVDVDNAENGGSETVTTLFTLATADATEDDNNWYPYGLMGRKDEKLIIRYIDSGALTAVTRAHVYGVEWDHR